MRRMFSEKQIEEYIKSTKKDIATLVDASGHERFVEGDITFETITGLTQTYGKWSLSGSHLMIVLAGSIEDATALQDTIAYINLPSWILDKISVLFGTSTVIRKAEITYSENGSTTQNATNSLIKSGSPARLSVQSYITTTAKRVFRYEFDLLVD